MKAFCEGLFSQASKYGLKYFIAGIISLALHFSVSAQTFEFPEEVYTTQWDLDDIVASSNRVKTVTYTGFNPADMSNATTGSNFTVKSVVSALRFKVNVQSANVGSKKNFTYLIAYEIKKYTDPLHPTVSSGTSLPDTLTVSYSADSLKMMNDRSFMVVGDYLKFDVEVLAVIEITGSGSSLTYNLLGTSATGIPDFVSLYPEVRLQKYMTGSLNVGSATVTDNLSVNGTVKLDWTPSLLIAPAGYEVEWTYSDPGVTSYDFRNNATRIFTNDTKFNIPVAQKEGTLVFRVRMVRPDPANFLKRIYGDWNLGTDNGLISNVSSNNKLAIAHSSNDDMNWDLKMSFVEDGKYKQVVTYYNGLLKPKQVQTRFNSKPTQTIIAQSLYDNEGRAVINSLPIPVDGKSKFGYQYGFLKPNTGGSEYIKSWYDAKQSPSECANEEVEVPALHNNAIANQYFSTNNNGTGKDAFIPDAEGYPFTRKILAAENSEKVLFEGKAGSALQLGNGKETEYLYGAPIQSELNKYFGQDIGKSNYYRKMITTDGHDQDMFSITDDDGKIVASGLIGSPETVGLALSLANTPTQANFYTNLLPVPDIRLNEHWRHNGSYFVEKDATYKFTYKFSYVPFAPCLGYGPRFALTTKIYYEYEVIDNCGNDVVPKQVGSGGAVGAVPVLANGNPVKISDGLPLIVTDNFPTIVDLDKGNHIWNKYAYIKLEDLKAAADMFLDAGGNIDCGAAIKSVDAYVKEEFENTTFPCESNQSAPCDAMKLAMMKEMYPRAKYGAYYYADTVSKTFIDDAVNHPVSNSIFSKVSANRYLYQDCLESTSFSNMSPQELINAFNDDIAEALLTLHPDYCELLACSVLNIQYCEGLARHKAPSVFGNNYLHGIVVADPLITYSPALGFVNDDFLKMAPDNDSLVEKQAFFKTICGSEYGVIESACWNINAVRQPDDIDDYPRYVQEEYYKNLIRIYTENREQRINTWLQNMDRNGCATCATGVARLVNPNANKYADLKNQDDELSLTSSADSISEKIDPGSAYSFGSTLDDTDYNKLKTANKSGFCKEMVSQIMSSLASCNVSQTLLNSLEQKLNDNFCDVNKSINALSYDSLVSLMTTTGISINDLCNAGLVDLKRITSSSGDYVQLGFLHYQPEYYQDLATFLDNENILDFITNTITGTTTVSLKPCDTYPFQKRLAGELGIAPNPSCSTVQVTLTATNLSGTPNAVKLTFVNTVNSKQLAYYLYPGAVGDTNALHADFNTAVVSSTGNYKIESLFNLYGFDKLMFSYANRNSTVLKFSGTRNSVSKNFVYFLSAFNDNSDYNLMAKDSEEYLNGVGCRELVPMVKNVVNKAQALNIRYGHPYFAKYLTNMLNYQNKINFNFDNYWGAIQSYGITDSIIIQKNIAHFRIAFSTSTTAAQIEAYIELLRNQDSIGISDYFAYRINSTNTPYLLLDVFEANDNNINDIKKTITVSSLPSGATVEYMPSLPVNTVAQLFVYQVNPLTNLATQFPSPTSINNVGVTIYHFKPGASPTEFSGDMVTMTNSSLTAPKDYNHYVNSIYKYIGANAPMTAIFSHAEPLVHKQYADGLMTTWRSYSRTLPADNHNANVAGSKAAAIKTAYSPSNYGVSYIGARNPIYRNDLYIDQAPGVTVGSNYDKVKKAIEDVKNYNYNKLFIATPKFGINDTRAFVCGNATQFWVNQFYGDQMINVFIQLPEKMARPKEDYTYQSIRKGFDKDSTTTVVITLSASIPSGGTDVIECVGYTNLNLGSIYTIPSAYLTSHGNFEAFTPEFENCEIRRLNELYPIAKLKYQRNRDSLRDIIVERFKQHIIDNLQEEFIIEGVDIKNGITLYYYDMAGNLVMTVPPEGVAEKAVATVTNNNTINNARLNRFVTADKSQLAAHTKTTRYSYNAQNKVTETTTPDAGTTKNYYDKAGRLMLSQNAKQAALTPPEYTYYLYDKLSRIVETGVIPKHNSSDWNDMGLYFRLKSITTDFVPQVKSLLRREVTATLYDEVAYDNTQAPFTTLPAQEHLKNRVSAVKYITTLPAGKLPFDVTVDYNNAMYYSYDVTGNVKTLIHDLKGVDNALLRFKRVDYEYDLYSGKVLMVSYNRGGTDQMYQKYKYDSDNRILEAYTSNNGIYWDRDANYEYYDHGPLARMVLGENSVQGVDYAYTINGWLKAINGVKRYYANDMGQDGNGTATPPDIFSQRIDYFTTDYAAIANANALKEIPPTAKSLYNGNIAGISTALAPFDNINNKYHYDQLHRIVSADYEKYQIPASGPSVITPYTANNYHSDYKYDMDGNLLELNRKGGDIGGVANTAIDMDKLRYTYNSQKNQLKSLGDIANIPTATYNIDIPYIAVDANASRYVYDANGNLIKDIVAGLDNIEWFNNGKLKSLRKTSNNSWLVFTYDALGNRLTKETIVSPNPDSMVRLKTIYVRDATGNILAIYEDKKEFDVNRLNFYVLKSAPWTTTGGSGSGTIPVILSDQWAHALMLAYVDDPGNNNIAQLAMTIPGLNDYVSTSGNLQSLISSFNQDQGLGFVKATPAVTAYTLDEENISLDGTKLSEYIQPVMMSDNMDGYITDVFVALKNNDPLLYNITTSTIPVSPMAKANFPANTVMLSAFKVMDMGDKLTIVNNLSDALLAGHVATLPYVRDVLVEAYSTANSHPAFISELPGGDVLLDKLKNDAVSFVAHRYTQADMLVVPLQTVKDEFKNNNFLIAHVASEAPAATTELLTGVITDHYGDFMAMAENNGQEDVVVEAFKGVMTVGAGDVVEVARSFLEREEVLNVHHQHLAEHHFYGSSRLGLQKYLPQEVQYHWMKLAPNNPANTLGIATTWYSLYAHDLFKPAALTSKDLLSSGLGTTEMRLNSHLLGNRHYELTNHLGNVQASILDRQTPKFNVGNAVTGYSADVSSAQDYYPFGMFMPARYIADESPKCVTITSSVLVPVYGQDYLRDNGHHHVQRVTGPNVTPVHDLEKMSSFGLEKLHLYHYNDPNTHPNGQLVTGGTSSGGYGEFAINLDGEPSGGVSTYLQLHMDATQTSQELGFEIDLPAGVYAQARIRQYTGSGDEYYESVEWSTIETSGPQEIHVPVDELALAAGGKTLLEIQYFGASGTFPLGGPEVFTYNYYLYVKTYKPETHVVRVCDEKDNYRFGFNKQEKVNEVAGIGNHYTATFWEYDSRLGRRWNLDPKPSSSLSPYSAISNNPIWFSDYKGDTVNVSNNIKNDAFWSKAYNNWAGSKQGKKFLQDYGIGGKYESTSVNFDVGEVPDEGTNRTSIVNRLTGEETNLLRKFGSQTIIPGIDKIAAGESKNEYLKFDITLTNSRSVSNLSERMANLFGGSKIKPMSLMVGMDNIMHEVQHATMDHSSLLTNKMIIHSYWQHNMMKNPSSPQYRDRYDLMKSNKSIWFNNYLQQRNSGTIKDEKHFINNIINDFRN